MKYNKYRHIVFIYSFNEWYKFWKFVDPHFAEKIKLIKKHVILYFQEMSFIKKIKYDIITDINIVMVSFMNRTFFFNLPIHALPKKKFKFKKAWCGPFSFRKCLLIKNMKYDIFTVIVYFMICTIFEFKFVCI